MLHLLVINFAKSWLDHYNRKSNEIDTPPWYQNNWQAPKDSVSHGLCKQRLGECQPIYKVNAINAQFGTALNLFSMEDDKNYIPIR